MAKITKTAIKRFAGIEPFPQPDIIRVQHPIVLMHGFGLLAFLAKGGHLHEEAMYLRVRGVMAFAPNVSPYQTIPERASMWRDRVQTILDQTGASKVNLIAHSMGGLDARYLISKLGLHDRVATLTTIATPHRGSSLAEIVLDQPGRVQDWLNDAANWFGERAMENSSADFHEAIQNLTPSSLAESFNPAVLDHPDVLYRSFAGSAGKGTLHSINPLLRPFNSLMFAREGVNDGFVSVNSAKWGDYEGELEADHAQQIGIDFMPSSSFSSVEFIAEQVHVLGEMGY
jgi:triacylglycerol lipase